MLSPSPLDHRPAAIDVVVDGGRGSGRCAGGRWGSEGSAGREAARRRVGSCEVGRSRGERGWTEHGGGGEAGCTEETTTDAVTGGSVQRTVK